MENRVERRLGVRANSPSLLAGLLLGHAGEGMTPSHAVKNGKRYRYYASRALTTGRRGAANSGQRPPAGEIEQLVADRIVAFLRDHAEVSELIAEQVASTADRSQLLDRAAGCAEAWPEMSTTEKRAVLLMTLDRIQIHSDRVDIPIIARGLTEFFRNGHGQSGQPKSSSESDEILTLSVPAQLKHVGKEIKLILLGGGPEGRLRNHDPSLIRLIVHAHTLRRRLEDARGLTLTDIAKQQGLGASYCTRVLRLAFLSPEITTAILRGAQPADLTPGPLMNDTRLPLDWREAEIGPRLHLIISDPSRRQPEQGKGRHGVGSIAEPFATPFQRWRRTDGFPPRRHEKIRAQYKAALR